MHRLLHLLESAWKITEPVQPMVQVAGSERASLRRDHAEMLTAFLAGDSAGPLRAAQHHHTRLSSVISTLSNDHGFFADPAPDHPR